MYLHELQNALLQATGTDVSTATICRFLHNQEFPRKKLSFRAYHMYKYKIVELLYQSAWTVHAMYRQEHSHLPTIHIALLWLMHLSCENKTNICM